ncbi:MAG: hypothetical protein A2498_13475 [Lentisphaerae bacterium RIFOXYC12_FULL_60_16]|nr:MAG: hypothetical protein A2498_13475 [Lentisphaerae bacterium RIFOXYC12_FULL_60_16]
MKRGAYTIWLSAGTTRGMRIEENSDHTEATMKRAGQRWCGGLLALVVAFPAFSVFAANTIWNQAGTGNWSEGGNWSLGEPGPGLLAYIDNNGTALCGAGEVSEGITLGSSANQNGTIRLDDATDSLTNTVNLVSLGMTGTGTLVLVNGSFYSDKGMRLGYYAAGRGYFNQSNGTAIFYADINIGASVGVGEVYQSGGRFELRTAGVNNGRFFIRNGRYDLVGGSLVVTGYNFNIGTDIGQVGRLVVNGAAAVLDIRDAENVNGVPVAIGNGGEGWLEVRQGTVYGDSGWLIGNSHTGRIVQTGGVMDLKTITMGNNAAGVGTYEGRAGVLRVEKIVWPDRSIRVGATGRGLFLMGDADGTLSVEQKTAGAGMTVRVTAGSAGECRGWSDNGITNRFGLTGPLIQNGRMVADGYGTDRTLNLTGMASLASTFTNGVAESNGWFAVNRGKLMLPPVTVSASAANWGEPAADTQPDMINAVRWTFTGATSGKLSGVLLATDCADVPGPGQLQMISVHGFTGVSGFTSGAMTLRYDPFAAAARGIAETDLKCFRWSGSRWQYLESMLDVDNKLIAVGGQTNLGTYAVGRVLNRGTVFAVQ